MDPLTGLVLGGVAFGRHFLGIITHPYATYRRLVEKGSWWELVYIGLLLAFYFALASLIKTAAFRPFLLTKHFAVLAAGAAGSYLVVVTTWWLLMRLLRVQGQWRTLAVAWGYTLVPTVVWFLATSILYLLLPPPRTTRLEGVIFSILYLVFSAMLFYWKLTLAYLTLRFGMRLDLVRILAVWGVTLPVLATYSFLMYRWGIFKVPFL